MTTPSRAENQQNRGPQTISEMVRQAQLRLTQAGRGQTPALDARLLAQAALNLSAEVLFLNAQDHVAQSQALLFWRFIERRVAGEPVSKIVGQREFWGVNFHVTKDVLDPRPESEVLIEESLRYFRARGLQNAPVSLVDLGTGSGCLLAALLLELPHARGIGIDISRQALKIAHKNLDSLGLKQRAYLLCGNWAAALKPGVFDLVICNPPYIATQDIAQLDDEVRSFDPIGALDGGEDGFSAYRQAIPHALQCLKATGCVIVECGLDQAEKIEEMFLAQCLNHESISTQVMKDLTGASRAVAIIRQC